MPGAAGRGVPNCLWNGADAVRSARVSSKRGVGENRPGRFVDFIRMAFGILKAPRGAFPIDRRGTVCELDVLRVLAHLLLEKHEGTIDARSAAAGNQRDFGPRLQIEDVVMHGIPLAIVE